MGLFNFGRDRGKAPKTPIQQGQEAANASEIALLMPAMRSAAGLAPKPSASSR